MINLIVFLTVENSNDKTEEIANTNNEMQLKYANEALRKTCYRVGMDDLHPVFVHERQRLVTPAASYSHEMLSEQGVLVRLQESFNKYSRRSSCWSIKPIFDLVHN